MNDAGVGFISGMVLAGVILGAGMFCQSDTHHRAVFQEQVEKHGCKVIPHWVNGVEKQGDLCVLPDGTILQR